MELIMNQEKRKQYNLKQLNIEIHKDILEQIKIKTEIRNIPMRTWILRAIIKSLREEI